MATAAVFDTAWQPMPALGTSAGPRPLLGMAGADGALHLFRAGPSAEGGSDTVTSSGGGGKSCSERSGGRAQAWSCEELSAVSLAPAAGEGSAPLCTSFGWAPPAAAGEARDVCSCGQDGAVHLVRMREVRVAVRCPLG